MRIRTLRIDISIAIVAIAVLVAVGWAGLLARDATRASAEPQRLTVTVGDALTFDPPAFTVRAGQPVELTVKNLGAMHHVFVAGDLPATDVRPVMGGHGQADAGPVVAHLQANGEVTVRFTPTRAGTYGFWCGAPGHRDAGMMGVITVG